MRMNNQVLVNYNRLWKRLIDKNLNKTKLREKAQISTNAIAKLGKNEFISMETLAKICIALECGVDDILEFTVIEK